MLSLAKILPALALSLVLSACVTTQPVAEPEPAPEVKPDPAAEAMAQWQLERLEAIEALRRDPHLSVTELGNKDVLVQIRSAQTFRTATVKLNDKLLPVLEHIAASLAPRKALALLVIGHTDNLGSPERNINLSTERAKAVSEALIALGIEESRVAFEGHGEAEPIAPNDSREGRAVNRRVDILIRPAL
ncbi:OmpA family protein [Azoarcus sp. L1K30]|uniref:OmpA family protein n=1 Tax=Azoarcus sp. L1K30 TaxID=2820277 RepID=UPI001B81CBEB|nr:OmpA family protein [Azoarcus sp. L1K30]MBR0564797.1 OmpA family protein [Azoarcus sp. L1K30]